MNITEPPIGTRKTSRHQAIAEVASFLVVRIQGMVMIVNRMLVIVTISRITPYHQFMALPRAPQFPLPSKRRLQSLMANSRDRPNQAAAAATEISPKKLQAIIVLHGKIDYHIYARKLV